MIYNPAANLIQRGYVIGQLYLIMATSFSLRIVNARGVKECMAMEISSH